jgi:polyhydroxybutyrate depolymerase
MPDIDARRLFVIGFSNGGFMAHRLACARGSDLAGIASMAGLGPVPGEACTPARPLRILEVHGGADVIVRPEGGRLFDDPNNPEHPALRVTIDAWARRNHCASAAPSSQTVDLIPTLPGNETTRLAFAQCAADVELWMIAGGGHMSVNAPGAVQAAIQRLLRN